MDVPRSPVCIRRACGARRQKVGSLSPEQDYWLIRPLIDAGLGLDRIRDLLFRLAFTAIVSEGQDTAASVTTLVDDQPPEIRCAWTEVIGRMISLHSSTS
jgi:hypothetical protein